SCSPEEPRCRCCPGVRASVFPQWPQRAPAARRPFRGDRCLGRGCPVHGTGSPCYVGISPPGETRWTASRTIARRGGNSSPLLPPALPAGKARPDCHNLFPTPPEFALIGLLANEPLIELLGREQELLPQVLQAECFQRRALTYLREVAVHGVAGQLEVLV